MQDFLMKFKNTPTYSRPSAQKQAWYDSKGELRSSESSPESSRLSPSKCWLLRLIVLSADPSAVSRPVSVLSPQTQKQRGSNSE